MRITKGHLGKLVQSILSERKFGPAPLIISIQDVGSWANEFLTEAKTIFDLDGQHTGQQEVTMSVEQFERLVHHVELIKQEVEFKILGPWKREIEEIK